MSTVIPTPSQQGSLSRDERIAQLAQRLRAYWPTPRRGAMPTADQQILDELTRLLPDSDGEPLETAWHRRNMNLLIDSVEWHQRDRNDFFVGGDMFLHYRVDGGRRFRGPDFFYVAKASPGPLRKKWVVWEEDDKYPDVIIELLSETTAELDRTVKKDLYEQTFRTTEYYCYDPEEELLEGWHLREGVYQPVILDKRGWAWSEVLQLWLGRWQGKYGSKTDVWLRFYDAAGGLALLEVEAERLEKEKERQRADGAEAETARLKARLAELERKATDGGG